MSEKDMIAHYLKIAWRNLLKYSMQSVVNVIGLAVGFACFAFANLWMRYESSFDSRYELPVIYPQADSL